ncbi:hypothetical protein J4456_03770 [Candidatus Pacearchaeota archaeon]|nr:hypothetical protein [Candidatus Pacearchaeota archaeon]
MNNPHLEDLLMARDVAGASQTVCAAFTPFVLTMNPPPFIILYGLFLNIGTSVLKGIGSKLIKTELKKTEERVKAFEFLHQSAREADAVLEIYKDYFQ